MEDIAQLILFIVMILIYSAGAILKKANEWVNRKRMEVDRHPSSSEKEVIHEGWPPAQPTPQPQPSPRPQPTPRQPQPSRDIAKEILDQFEMMLPPEIQEVRRKAREMAQQRSAPPPAPVPAPQPVKPKADAQKKKPAPPRHVRVADQHYEGALKAKPILQQLNVHSPDDLRRVFLFQEILKPPIAERPPTPFFE